MAVEPEGDVQEGSAPGRGVEPSGTSGQVGSENHLRAAEETYEDEDEDEEEGEEDEPKLKYERLTRSLSSVYRNGDATSAFIIAGDKMIIGTHNGNINVLSVPSFQSLRSYHAHSASISALSTSPFPIALPTPAEVFTKSSDTAPSVGKASGAPTASQTVSAQPRISQTPSNSIHIATASIDGHVCVSSLVDSKDVTLRNFARPVQAVALSPEYKQDRSYLSGGLAGELILTTDGRPGTSSNANTNSAAGTASGWLGSIGLGSSSGKDTLLHSGEGSISVIKWSLSGKFVAWVNESGIKIMRTNLRLETADTVFAWKRMAHVDRPNRRGWEDMASVWKARAEWIDDSQVEPDGDDHALPNGLHRGGSEKPEIPGRTVRHPGKSHRTSKPERLVVGWGDTAWVLNVHPGGTGVGRDVGERSIGRADVAHQLRFDDCTISGLTFYTPSLLLVLAYRTGDDDGHRSVSSPSMHQRRGVHHRQNGLSPEVRLVNVLTKEEVDTDTLAVSRFETLSAADYHLSTLYVSRHAASTVQRGTLEALGGGLWDAGKSATRMFSSNVSTKSIPRSGEHDKVVASGGSASASKTQLSARRPHEPQSLGPSSGLKIFIHSPYDCVLAIKRELVDRLAWLEKHHKYREAWELLNEHPEVGAAASDRPSDSAPSTPQTSQQSLAEFFADDDMSQTTESASRVQNSAVEKEKRRIGDLWLKQILFPKDDSQKRDWSAAGKVAGRVLNSSEQWEKWVWTFTQAGRFDEITPYVPNNRMRPPLPSIIYELVLGHYIRHDRARFRELLNHWDPHLYEIGSITSAIEEQLRLGEVSEDTTEGGERGRDWRLLLDGLAQLYLADGKPKAALRRYIQLQNADAAMGIIRDYHLLAAVADDIPGFLLLRVSREQLEALSTVDLEELSSEGVHLLVDEAFQGVVQPTVVVRQLEHKGKLFRPFLFFYLRALWKGQGSVSEFSSSSEIIRGEGDDFVATFGDRVLDLFAEYDRPLLMEFLKTSHMYRFEKAAAVCEARDYIPELVFILSKTGETRRALFLIIDKLGDVSQAIRFAKEQDDQDIWDHLLDYSMDKPRFIRGLLEEVGTSIDPIALVRRIPEGLEIEGLREGVGRMIREYEIQHSISEGVARVLRGEVAAGMDQLRAGQKRGVKFEVVHEDEGEVEVVVEPLEEAEGVRRVGKSRRAQKPGPDAKPGYCRGCKKRFAEDDSDTLIGFACGHVYHLDCILTATSSTRSPSASAALNLQDRFAADAGTGFSSRSVAAKVDHAHIVRNAIKAGCPRCHM